MASAGLGSADRHLRDLFGAGTAVGQGDGQLLARYASARDGVAFEALVARHGPLVLATCRAILRDEHDVEDAFQATFLVLARRAGSIRGGQALAAWLHRVARRTSLRLASEAGRRRRKEAEASAMKPPVESHAGAGPDPDLLRVVHEEVDRLPDSRRLPVVLCDLQGLSYEQAAGQLRWTVPTFRNRLARARQELRGRLTRRGIAAPAVAALLAASSSATASAVPSTLARATVAAATGGGTSAGALALSHAVTRGMLMTKLKLAATAALAAMGLATAAVIATGTGRDDAPRPATPPDTPVAVPADVPPPDAKPGKMIEIRGRVVAPDGRPVEGASVCMSRDFTTGAPGPEAVSGPGGRFAISIPEAVRNRAVAYLDTYPRLVASSSSFAPGWVAGIFRPDAPPEQTIILAEPGPAIEGRVVDLEGRPVAGARVAAKSLWYAKGGDIAPWLASVRVSGTRGVWSELETVRLDPPSVATTDADGRYRLPGPGRDRIVGLLLSGPTVTTETLHVMGRDEPEVRSVDKGWIEPRPFVVHAPRFQHAAAPTRPIEGLIRDKDTSRPIAGLKIRGNILRESDHTWVDGLEVTTDAEGRYRIVGLPRAQGYQVFTFPRRGSPYLNGRFVFSGSTPGPEPIPFDIALKRGVLVRGRVIDKANKTPARASIDIYALADNPHAADYPGHADGYRSDATVDDDGRFEAVTLPGRCLLGVRSDDARYLSGVIVAPFELPRKVEGGRVAVPTTTGTLYPQNYHTLAGVDIPPGTEEVNLEIPVDPGRSLWITAVDADGKPIGGLRVQGIGDIYQRTYRREAATFEVYALNPSSPRRVTIAHEGRKLIGSIFLKGDESGPLTVRLQPWGTLVGRVIDEEGRPRPGVQIHNRFGVPEKQSAEVGVLPGRDWGSDRVTDGDGRFLVQHLVPGLNYSASAVEGSRGLGDLFRGQILAPGEVKDLGDLKPTPYKPGVNK